MRRGRLAGGGLHYYQRNRTDSLAALGLRGARGAAHGAPRYLSDPGDATRVLFDIEGTDEVDNALRDKLNPWCDEARSFGEI